MTRRVIEEGRVVEDPVFRQRHAFARGEDEEGEYLRVETWVDPGGGVTAHVHPRMRERFEVLEGNPEFLAGRKWQRAEPGDVVVVEPGVRHAFRNRADAVAHFVCDVRPPSTLREFLEDVAGLSRAGRVRPSGRPRGLGDVLYGAVLLHHHREMVTMMSPPPFLQRIALGPLARLAERRGYRPGSFAQYDS